MTKKIGIVGSMINTSDYLLFKGFIAGAEWAMKLKHAKVKLMCIKDSNKRCNQCHECDVYVLNPSY